MTEELFIRLDGDRIGDSIELALMNDDPKEAQDIHNRVQQSIAKIVKHIDAKSGARILLVGSDDILFKMPIEKYEDSFLREVNEIFFQNSKFTLSIGVGRSISQALVSLAKAKLSGRNRIVFDLSLDKQI